ERNAAAGHFSRKPFGAVLGGAICFVASLANSHAIRLRLASRISPRQAAPRPHGILHQPASGIATALLCAALTVASPARAQNYPAKPVRIILPFSTGGTDFVTR